MASSFTSSHSHWDKLSNLPGGGISHYHHFKLMKMDSSHFSTVNNGIMTYNTNGNNWIIEGQQIFKNTNGPSCYDPISKQIYIAQQHVRTKTMHIFDIQTKKATKLRTSFGESVDAIWMDSSCHIIGGGIDGNLHEIWNDNTKKLQHIHTFHEFARINPTNSGLTKFGLIYSSKRKELLLFGGQHQKDIHDQPPLDIIYRYSVSTRNWKKLDHKLPQKMYDFGCAITKCQRYIIVLGGEPGEDYGYRGCNEIFILKPATMQFIKSTIKLPFHGGCRAIIMEDKNKNDLLVHGFVKNEVNKYNMNIPFALIGLIGVWHSIEYIHVISKINGSHWKINVDAIIKE